jgi:hypothetical protein
MADRYLTREQMWLLENPSRNRKLTVEQVLEVRLLQAQGKVDFGKLSREFGVHRDSVRLAALGHTFKDLPMPPKRPR